MSIKAITMKIVALLAIASLVWSARQPGKENDAEDQMPETIWIGSPYGLIPYDIDWAYFNKSTFYFMHTNSFTFLLSLAHFIYQ